MEYTNKKVTRAEVRKSFAEIASQKMAEAEKESGVDGHITKCGLWISNDGKHAHITYVIVQTAVKWA